MSGASRPFKQVLTTRINIPTTRNNMTGSDEEEQEFAEERRNLHEEGAEGVGDDGVPLVSGSLRRNSGVQQLKARKVKRENVLLEDNRGLEALSNGAVINFMKEYSEVYNATDGKLRNKYVGIVSETRELMYKIFTRLRGMIKISRGADNDKATIERMKLRELKRKYNTDSIVQVAYEMAKQVRETQADLDALDDLKELGGLRT